MERALRSFMPQLLHQLPTAIILRLILEVAWPVLD